jgi:hypothetical protein
VPGSFGSFLISSISARSILDIPPFGKNGQTVGEIRYTSLVESSLPNTHLVRNQLDENGLPSCAYDILRFCSLVC